MEPPEKSATHTRGCQAREKKTLAHDDQAVAVFERFTGRGATYERADIFPTVSNARWRTIGKVYRIDYTSDKGRRQRVEYTHESGAGVRLYRYGAVTKPPWVWAIKGGRMTVTERGIVH